MATNGNNSLPPPFEIQHKGHTVETVPVSMANDDSYKKLNSNGMLEGKGIKNAEDLRYAQNYARLASRGIDPKNANDMSLTAEVNYQSWSTNLETPSGTTPHSTLASTTAPTPPGNSRRQFNAAAMNGSVNKADNWIQASIQEGRNNAHAQDGKKHHGHHVSTHPQTHTQHASSKTPPTVKHAALKPGVSGM